VVRKAKVRATPTVEPYELFGVEGSGAVIADDVIAVDSTRGTLVQVYW